MGLGRWSDAKSVLGQFVVNEFLDPNPEEWYDVTIMMGDGSV